MQEFIAQTKIIAGSGSLETLKDLGLQRLLVVSDPYFVENGTAQRVAKLSCAPAAEIFSEVAPDPSVELAARGTARIKEFDPDGVVALGGGSAMDLAKAMVYFSGSTAKTIMVPTTSGSGSEVTDFAILTSSGVKHPLVDPRLRPDVAILDGQLLQQLPKKLIADSGFDVLSHALEAMVAKNAGPISDCLASAAFACVYANLPASYGGAAAVRLKIHTAATMAGVAFSNAGLGLCHAMAHALGGLFHVPHGRLNAILLPEIIECNGHAAGEKYARIALAAGVGGSAQTMALRNLKNALIRLRRELHMPETLAQAGVDPMTVRYRTEDIVTATLQDPCCATNPMEVEGYMVRRVLEKVVGRV